jgi:hypothetical protein
VPPFIVFYSATESGRAVVLFTDPLHCPPRIFLSTFPKRCTAVKCTDDDCGFFNLPESRCLMKGSKMVRQGVFQKGVVLCNLWGCNMAHNPEDGQTLSRCQKCKEALYCSVEHQVTILEVYVSSPLNIVGRGQIGRHTKGSARPIRRRRSLHLEAMEYLIKRIHRDKAFEQPSILLQWQRTSYTNVQSPEFCPRSYRAPENPFSTLVQP